ncbi:efflux RND transporter periplasmic adaptor subunit [Microbacterium flavum]|uniref:Efflux RND transporter periplasmic adaptor subunit n=1 Tax=Microbacterium flavum TaxID=415216 RepID=A0ABS5XUN2_9MICO|nr:efflux RND transporter periplasmic adaptor subunit [Microbacterium flavum]MBT8798251.1 efflux RND transporter periplasmic adaptor subunit [Microbacterium flavum]
MLVWRRWIFPLLLLIVCAAVAAALVKLAFFPDRTDAATLVPGGGVTTPVVAVERGSITSALTVDGTIARDDAITVRAQVEGTITEVAVGAGQSVAAGQILFTVKQVETNRRIDVTAPEAGDLTSFELVAGQSVSLGAEVAKLTPARFHVVGKVDPVQLYRLVGAPTEAQVTIQGGPAPFTCTGLRVQVAEDGTTSMICAVPGDQQVFAGLKASLAVQVGTATDVLVVPTTAVTGGAGTGTVWVDADGATEERSVQLGLTDGTSVEITGGLEEGETVRQFVPGTTEGTEPVCYEDGAGGTYCESPGMSW